MAFETLNSMTWNVLIVDNEPPVRERVRLLLSEHMDFCVVAEASDGESALPKIVEGNIHLMFLDIQSYRSSNCALLQQLPSAHLPVTVFLTNSRNHALDALEILSAGYLLKPINPARMTEVLFRARSRLTDRFNTSLSHNRLAKLLVRKGARELLVGVESINWIEADGNYVTIHCDGDKHLMRCSIGELEQQIDRKLFLRVNRSALVNVDRVAELRHAGKTVQVVLNTGESLPATLGLRELRERVQFR